MFRFHRRIGTLGWRPRDRGVLGVWITTLGDLGAIGRLCFDFWAFRRVFWVDRGWITLNDPIHQVHDLLGSQAFGKDAVQGGMDRAGKVGNFAFKAGQGTGAVEGQDIGLEPLGRSL